VQRLLLVTGDLTVLASIDAACGSVGLSNGITSLLWVGPALLYMTAAGQVRSTMCSSTLGTTNSGYGTQHVARVLENVQPLVTARVMLSTACT
jgi:hypothetical protein